MITACEKLKALTGYLFPIDKTINLPFALPSAFANGNEEFYVLAESHMVETSFYSTSQDYETVARFITEGARSATIQNDLPHRAFRNVQKQLRSKCLGVEKSRSNYRRSLLREKEKIHQLFLFFGVSNVQIYFIKKTSGLKKTHDRRTADKCKRFSNLSRSLKR